MDYFHELLNSYNQLKKRSFKLRYISEQEDNGESTQEDMDAQTTKDAEEKALEVVKAGLTQQHDPSKQVQGGEPYTYLGAKTGKINLVGGPVGAGWPMPVADSNGTPDVGSEGWKKLVNYFKEGGDEKTLVAAERGAAEAQRKAELEGRVGGATEARVRKEFEETGAIGDWVSSGDPEEDEQKVKEEVQKRIGEGEKREYRKQLALVDTWCRTAEKDGEDFPAHHPCNKNFTYVAGGANTSLEWQLANGKVECLDPVTQKKIGDNCEVPKGLRDEVARSETRLLQFLFPEKEAANCEAIRDRVGVHGDRLVLFGDKDPAQLDEPPTVGIVMKPNAMQQRALDNIKDHCDWGTAKDADGKDVPITMIDILERIISNAGLNAIKGGIYELVPQFLLRIQKAKRLEDAGKETEAKKVYAEIVGWFSRIKKEKVEMLSALAERLGAESIDEYVESNLAGRELALLGDSRSFAAYIAREAQFLARWMDTMPGIRTVVHMALHPQQGGREDNGFVFDDSDEGKEEAHTAAKRYGSSAKRMSIEEILKNTPESEREFTEEQLKEELPKGATHCWVMGFGQKRKDIEKNTVKIGECGTLANQSGMVNEDPNDEHVLKSVKAGFLKKVNDVLFGKVGKKGELEIDAAGRDRQEKQRAYGSEVLASVESVDALMDSVTYVDADGNLRVQQPEQVAEMLSSEIFDGLSFEGVTDSYLGNLFFDDSDPPEARALDIPETRERIHEGIRRAGMWSRYAEDYRDPAQRETVTDLLIKNLMVDGFNLDAMSQQMQYDNGDLAIFAQNEGMERIVAARNAEPSRLRIEFKGTTAIFHIMEGGEVKGGEIVGGTEEGVMKFSQEGTWSGDADAKARGERERHTRSVTTAMKNCWSGKRNLAPPKEAPKAENAGIFYEFLKGQQSLLEKLLTPSTEHRSYQV